MTALEGGCLAPIEVFDKDTLQSKGFAAPCHKSDIYPSKAEIPTCTPKQLATCRACFSVMKAAESNTFNIHRRVKHTDYFKPFGSDKLSGQRKRSKKKP